MSKQVDYALQLMYALSKLKKDEYLSLRKFAVDSKISFLFLQRIARSLKKANFIDAARGVRGGYYCLINPKHITLKELMTAVDGPFGITDCTKGMDCPRKKTCTACDLFSKINKHIEQVLNQTRILDRV